MPTLYTLSFVFFVILTGLAVVASGISIVVQARLPKGIVANWNVFIVVGSYVALALISAIIWISRRRQSAKRLRAIPKAYIPIKDGDVPKDVVRLVATEYDRAACIAYVSLPKGAKHPGWGAPGTEFEGMSFRREIPATFRTIATAAQKLLPSLPAPSPFVRPAAYLLPLSRLVKMVNESAWDDVERYSELVELCRYGGPPSAEMYREARDCVTRIESVFDTIQLALNKGGQSAMSLLTSSEHWTQDAPDDESYSNSTVSDKRIM
ncbi:hypothetical protein CTheo_7951 [Ceratobasidium theobromae]|uniref:Defect at low temperature protein 1 n=1 Tax=Ceratobasidium theobromae TaxID=1582974 RepID=A0A5N5QB31_9AGAM|nr:hypothetical protein CTheo_7951 [Ceratobasidium theobromae]